LNLTTTSRTVCSIPGTAAGALDDGLFSQGVAFGRVPGLACATRMCSWRTDGWQALGRGCGRSRSPGLAQVLALDWRWLGPGGSTQPVEAAWRTHGRNLERPGALSSAAGYGTGHCCRAAAASGPARAAAAGAVHRRFSCRSGRLSASVAPALTWPPHANVAQARSALADDDQLPLWPWFERGLRTGPKRRGDR